MGDINIGDMTDGMIQGFSGVVKEGWPQIKGFATAEIEILAESLVRIKLLQETGQIRKNEAKSLLRQHKNTTTAVLAGIEGMSRLVAEQAVNAAFKVIRDAVNTAAGFKLV